MKELYLAIAVLCFLVAGMMYYTYKTIYALKEIYIIWKNYKQAQQEIMNYLKDKK